MNGRISPYYRVDMRLRGLMDKASASLVEDCESESCRAWGVNHTEYNLMDLFLFV